MLTLRLLAVEVLVYREEGEGEVELRGRVAVVTGAGSGIGRGLARRLAAEGMNVVLSGLHLDPLRSTAAKLADLDVDVLCVPTDVAQLADVEALADKSIDRFGEVHLLCNNAGVAMPGAVGQISMEDWRWTLSVNLWGPIHGVQVFLPLMERQGVGHITSTASESGLYATSHLGAYNVSKFGVVGLMTSLARDLRARSSPVTASVFCPGATATAITSSSRDRSAESMTEHAEPSTATEQFWKAVRGAVAAGMEPDEAAGFVVDAIKDGRFWIFSHPHVPATALKQAQVMAESRDLIDL